MQYGNGNTDFQPKVVLLGDAKVGKTSILNRQLHGFSPNAMVTSSTLGCHYNEIVVNVGDKQVNLEVWDTAGQEMYRSLAPIYLRGAKAAIIVYDVTDPTSFKAINEWHKIFVDSVSSNEKVFIVANKIDLTPAGMSDDTAANNLSESMHATFIKTSAFTGQGVEYLFSEVAKSLLESHSANEVIQKTIREEEKKSRCC